MFFIFIATGHRKMAKSTSTHGVWKARQLTGISEGKQTNKQEETNQQWVNPAGIGVKAQRSTDDGFILCAQDHPRGREVKQNLRLALGAADRTRGVIAVSLQQTLL